MIGPVNLQQPNPWTVAIVGGLATSIVGGTITGVILWWIQPIAEDPPDFSLTWLTSSAFAIVYGSLGLAVLKAWGMFALCAHLYKRRQLLDWRVEERAARPDTDES